MIYIQYYERPMRAYQHFYFPAFAAYLGRKKKNEPEMLRSLQRSNECPHRLLISKNTKIHAAQGDQDLPLCRSTAICAFLFPLRY